MLSVVIHFIVVLDNLLFMLIIFVGNRDVFFLRIIDSFQMIGMGKVLKPVEIGVLFECNFLHTVSGNSPDVYVASTAEVVRGSCQGGGTDDSLSLIQVKVAFVQPL